MRYSPTLIQPSGPACSHPRAGEGQHKGGEGRDQCVPPCLHWVEAWPWAGVQCHPRPTRSGGFTCGHSQQVPNGLSHPFPGRSSVARGVRGSGATVCPEGLGPGHPGEQSHPLGPLLDGTWGLCARVRTRRARWAAHWGPGGADPAPLLSHEMTGVLALVGLSQDRKRDPERHFQSKKRRSRKPGHFGSGDGGAPWE